MDRTERFYKIDQLLQGGLSVSFAKLQEALGISRSQVKRDLAYMRERLNAPIEYNRDLNGYRFGKPLAGPRYGLPGLWFSAAEIHALLSMQHLLENLQPGLLTPHVKPLLSRFAAILGSADHSQEEVVRRVRVLHQAARELKHERFALAASATLNRRRLKIRHYNRMEDRETERVISPLAARWVASQDWHPKQKGEIGKDGSYSLSIPYANDRELVMDILKYGPEVEVLEPAALRRRVAAQLRAAAKLYR